MPTKNKMKKFITNEDVAQFKSSFVPWGYSDIESAMATYREAGKTDDELADAILEYMESTNSIIDNLDICYIAYDTLQQEARQEIETETGKDISNDAPYYNVTIFANYLDTQFDGNDEARMATKKLIETMKQKSQVVKWYYNEL